MDEIPQKILITGATGIVGMQLCADLLVEGYAVHALIRTSSKTLFLERLFRHRFGEKWKAMWDKIIWVDGDILDIPALEKAIEGIDQVVHAAAVVSFHPRDRKSMWKTNVEGTANVLNVAKDAGVKHAVHVSSVAALGRQEKEGLLNEETEWKNDPEHSTYARTKYMAEQEAMRTVAEGMPVSVVNPSIIIGYGDPDRSSTEAFKRVKEGLSLAPKGKTGFVAVQDVSKAIQLLLKKPQSGERFILVGAERSYQAFLGSIARAFGVKAPSKSVSKTQAKWAARLLWLRERLTGIRAFLTQESVRSSYSNYSYDNSKSKEVLGMEYLDVDEAVEGVVGVMGS